MFECIDMCWVLWKVIDVGDKKVVWIVVLIYVVDWLEVVVDMMLMDVDLEVVVLVKEVFED